jgi:hypothetical protein
MLDWVILRRRNVMHKKLAVLCVLGLLGSAAYGATEKHASKPQGGQTVVIVFKDGHQQSFAMGDVARIEFKGSASSDEASTSESMPGRGHFLGKWELGEGNGQTFIVTLDSSGNATKSIGSNPHGTWTVVNGEARITWDEGSFDAIRKVGGHYMKFWHPDGNFSGEPRNVSSADHIAGKPI